MNINITEYPNSYAEVKLGKSESITAEKEVLFFQMVNSFLKIN